MMVYGVGIECPFKEKANFYTCMTDGDIYFITNLNRVKTEEIEAFQNGEWWFSVREDQEHLVLVAKNSSDKGEIGVYEFIFSLNKTNKVFWDKFLSLQVGEAYPIHMMLVDSKTNIVLGMRIFGLSRAANQFMLSVFSKQVRQVPQNFDTTKLPESLRKSFDIGFIKEKSGTK